MPNVKKCYTVNTYILHEMHGLHMKLLGFAPFTVLMLRMHFYQTIGF